jgi:hypothetical protein
VAHDPLCNWSSLSLMASGVTVLRLPPALAAAAVTCHLPIPADTSRYHPMCCYRHQLLPTAVAASHHRYQPLPGPLGISFTPSDSGRHHRRIMWV